MTVNLPPEQIADDPELALVELTVPADSLMNDDGTRGTEVGIFRVASDRLPAPLPDGLDHGFDITVQADADFFDTTAPITFPNMEGLAPGEKVVGRPQDPGSVPRSAFTSNGSGRGLLVSLRSHAAATECFSLRFRRSLPASTQL